jgi:cell division protein FtsQ
MLGDFIYSADVGTASAEAADSMEAAAPYRYAAPQKFEKTIRRFLLLSVIFISGGLLWIFCISPCMVPAKIEVKSFMGLSRADVLNIAGIGGNAAYISIDAEEVERRLAGYYLVESARVVKRFPDRLSVFLEPRRAVAMVFANVNGKTQPVYFDRYGVAFKIGNAAGEASPSWLPIVSGVLDDDRPLRPGMRVSAAYLPLFSRIGAISDEDPKIWQTISEIGIAKKEKDIYDLVLYPVHDSIKLRMRNDISKDSIYYALLMFDVCRQLGDGVPDEIDVRSGIGVVSAGEGRFGK